MNRTLRMIRQGSIFPALFKISIKSRLWMLEQMPELILLKVPCWQIRLCFQLVSQLRQTLIRNLQLRASLVQLPKLASLTSRRLKTHSLWAPWWRRTLQLVTRRCKSYRRAISNLQDTTVRTYPQGQQWHSKTQFWPQQIKDNNWTIHTQAILESATSSTRVRWQEGIQASSRKRGILSPATRSRPVAQMWTKHKAKVQKSTIMRRCHRQATLPQEKKKPRIFLLQLYLVRLSCSDSRQNSIDHLRKVRVHVMQRIARITTKKRHPSSKKSSMHARTTMLTTAWRW